MHHWVADNPSIHQQWVDHLSTYKLSDKRHSRYPTHLIKPEKLQLDVLPHEIVIIRDLESGEVIGTVIRNFGTNQELLYWASSILKKSTDISRSVRVST